MGFPDTISLHKAILILLSSICWLQDFVLANHEKKIDGLVEISSNTTLTTYVCSDQIKYTRDCISEVSAKVLKCSTNESHLKMPLFCWAPHCSSVLSPQGVQRKTTCFSEYLSDVIFIILTLQKSFFPPSFMLKLNIYFNLPIVLKREYLLLTANCSGNTDPLGQGRSAVKVVNYIAVNICINCG